MPEGPANGEVDRGGPARPPCTPCPETSVPRVDVRVVLFTVREGGLLIALQERDGCRALPRWVPTLGESLDAVATRILDDQIGSSERYQEQLYSISHGSEGNGTVSVTYLALAVAEAADTYAGLSRVVQCKCAWRV